jgi:hypothetical protein
VIGVVGTKGTFTTSMKLGNLAVSDPGATLFMQARFVDPVSGSARLSNLHTVVELDASY